MGRLGHIPGALSNPPSKHLSGLRQSSGGVTRDGRGELNIHLLITDNITFFLTVFQQIGQLFTLKKTFEHEDGDVQTYSDMTVCALVCPLVGSIL